MSIKIITKTYLVQSLKDFNDKVLSKIYAKIPGNQSVLDKIDESDSGDLTYNGQAIKAAGTDGEDGFSPVIEENSENSRSVYKLDISTKTGSFTTVNLKGMDGLAGASAYETAVQNGFDGTEQEWLDSLHGKDAEDCQILATMEEVETNTESGKLVDALIIKKVFQSVSDGKKIIALAITDKGIDTSADDTFVQMGKNIRMIQNSDCEGGETISIKPFTEVFIRISEGSPQMKIETISGLFLEGTAVVKSYVNADISVTEG